MLLAVAVVVGCAPADREVRLERLAAERRTLEATFDHLEDRLLVNQARVRFWEEMRGRHESVSAIACASQDQHAQAMAAHAPTPVPGHSSLHRSRVASASPAAVERVPASAPRRD